MEAFVERMIKERDDLKDKVDKLDTFIKSEKFEALSHLEQIYLKNQLRFMDGYLDTLDSRIEYYEGE